MHYELYYKMYKETWNKCCQSICSIIFKDYAHNILGSGTGFKVKENFIITNHHVFIGYLNAEYIEISFVENDGYTKSFFSRLNKNQFLKLLKDSLPENSWDFAILEIKDVNFKKIPSLEFSFDFKQIGSNISVIGFQFGQKNLSIKTGIISSYFEEIGVKKIQIDSTINKGNSGGPLIDVVSQKVIGVITRKKTGLTQAFDDLIIGYRQNIEFIQKSGVSLRMSNFDVIEILIKNQRQMQITSQEIERSSNVGIGYAFTLDKIKEFFI